MRITRHVFGGSWHTKSHPGTIIPKPGAQKRDKVGLSTGHHGNKKNQPFHSRKMLCQRQHRGKWGRHGGEMLDLDSNIRMSWPFTMPEDGGNERSKQMDGLSVGRQRLSGRSGAGC